ncbi:phosphoribosyltransferase [Mycobacterium shottsii]|nr:phosphoribosyltransferase [Mycobacterium shottsii]
MHVVTSCYLEGLLVSGTHFCVYPSSKMGKVSAQLQEYVLPASRLVHGFYKDDLLDRYRNATDTSLERVNAKRQGRTPNVSILDQANTVKVDGKYIGGKLAGRTVVVFDDFMTQGTSLSWAYQLLSAAGASKVVLVSIGKYGGGRFLQKVSNGAMSPFEKREYSGADFYAE